MSSDDLGLPVNYDELDWKERREVREKYIKHQQGLCHYCKSSLKEEPPDKILSKKVTPRLYPDGFFKNPIHLHHDHRTSMTIGAVHAYCNAVLWEHHDE